LANLFTFLHFFFFAKQKTAFGILCLSFTFSNILILFPMLLWLFILVLYGYFSGIYSRFVTSINRFIAIVLPTKYDKTFSKKNVYIILVIYWSLSLLMCVPFSFDNKCYFMVSDRIWSYAQTIVCLKVAYIEDFLFGTTFGSLTILVDFLLICALFVERYFLLTNGKISIKRSGVHSNEFSLKLDLNIFYRTLLSNLYLIFMLICFYYVSIYFIENVNLLFSSTSLVWVSYHALDGIVVGLMNKDVKKSLRKCFNIKSKKMKSQKTKISTVTKQKNKIYNKTTINIT
uniref:G_PROTEIN_RECEP_F1_2 domain-containing protein n=1 Tax=Strongyloides papillosus TaxID=174720 RepID=A0A0N5C2T4_STREA